MRKRLEPVIEALQRTTTLEDLQATILALRDRFGVDHLVYYSAMPSDRPYAALTYPSRWVERYVEQRYARIDPVVQGCFGRFSAVDWKHLDWSARKVRAFLAEALEEGIGNQGLSVPIRGPNGKFALFTLSHRSPDALWESYTRQHIDDVILVAHFVSQKALEIESGPDPLPATALSPREVDVLTLLATGHSRAHAAESLGISEHTLRVYIESARRKLGAANTTHAVACALTRGLLVV
ncbi:LuxR family transcriptional regulator [Ostreiculturibacter nitratireducens]|uniref:helix-turn-helix transcriptional regulator n=1 Tax=Ostreiculturibacter nitratireducens TaxID=3075226 RepID=UPI0031B5D9BF